MIRVLLLLPLLAVAACRTETVERPGPTRLTSEAIAHYCLMNIAEHPGPKAQIYLSGIPDPIFFAQVRDAFTYLASAEQDGYVAAVYVSDMASGSWEVPGADNWMLAEEATYVVGSSRVGGMGVPELVPFGTESAAASFAAEFGGTAYGMKSVPPDAYLAPVEYAPPSLDEDNS